jgi:hypothetical protein
MWEYRRFKHINRLKFEFCYYFCHWMHKADNNEFFVVVVVIG